MATNQTNFPKIYMDIMHDLMSHSSSTNAQTTIEGLRNLYIQRQMIAAIDNETKRNNEIYKVCHLEVDTNFLTSPTKEGRLNEINEMIQLLVEAYTDAKKNDNLDHFFTSAFESDSHINHRLEHLNLFYMQHKGKKAIKSV